MVRVGPSREGMTKWCGWSWHFSPGFRTPAPHPRLDPSLSQNSLLEQWAMGLVNRGAEGVILAGAGVWWPCVWVSPLMHFHILVFFLQGCHGRWLL